MKVLWFTSSPSLAETYLKDEPIGSGWIKSLEKSIQDKVDMSVAFYSKKADIPFEFNGSKYYPVKRKNHNFIHKVLNRFFSNLESEKDVESFLKVIDEVKPDLIHIHGAEFNYGLIQEHTNIPVVISIQGTIPVYKYKFFSGISFFDALKYTSLKTWLSFNSYINNYYYFKKQARREKRIYKCSKNFIGRTHWDRRVTKVLSPTAQYFHNDEIMRDSFYINEWNNPLNTELKIFTTSSKPIYKGLETILYTAHLLDQNNVNFKWQIAGVKKLDEIVKISSKSLGVKVSDNIDFLGHLSEEKLVDNLLKTNIYVAVSHIENSPNSLCEAQMLGIPCIAGNAGGTSTLIKDNVDGVLVQDGDPYVLAGAIVELKENYSFAIELGKQGRQNALARHNREKITRELLEIYKKLTH